MDADAVRCTVPQGSFRLERRHRAGRAPLRAWDAADVLMLEHVSQTGRAGAGSTVVLLDDAHGALTTALAAATIDHGVHLVHRSDSFTARRAAQENLRRNGLDIAAIDWTTSLDAPPERVDVLIARVPRDTAALDDQLRRLRPAMDASTHVVAAAMVKHLHRPAIESFTSVLGEVRPSLAAHKARLLFVDVDASTASVSVSPPVRWRVDPADGALRRTIEVVGLPGVFSFDRLDPGTSLLLGALASAPSSRRWSSVVDLGCGTGVIAAALGMTHSDAVVWALDDSWRAAASAELTFGATNEMSDRLRVRVADALDESFAGDLPADRSVDAVVVNPPFHDGNALSDAIARRMFLGARRVLRPGGELWVVGNRHLGYHLALGRLFGRPQVMASDPRFSVLRVVAR